MTTTHTGQRRTLERQAEMMVRAAEADVSEPNDLADIVRRSEQFSSTCREMDEASASRL